MSLQKHHRQHHHHHHHHHHKNYHQQQQLPRPPQPRQQQQQQEERRGDLGEGRDGTVSKWYHQPQHTREQHALKRILIHGNKGKPKNN
jgi:hypothetical protein